MSYWETLGATDDWYTPKYIFDALGVIFDDDVAAAPTGANVPARHLIFQGGLEAPWRGFVWMNPPFGGRNGLAPWLKKFITHGNGIALVPDRTSAPWFQAAAAEVDSILFLSPKVKFERPDGSRGGSPSTGTALLAVGYKGMQALINGSNAGLGLLVEPV